MEEIRQTDIYAADPNINLDLVSCENVVKWMRFHWRNFGPWQSYVFYWALLSHVRNVITHLLAGNFPDMLLYSHGLTLTSYQGAGRKSSDNWLRLLSSHRQPLWKHLRKMSRLRCINSLIQQEPNNCIFAKVVRIIKGSNLINEPPTYLQSTWTSGAVTDAVIFKQVKTSSVLVQGEPCGSVKHK